LAVVAVAPAAYAQTGPSGGAAPANSGPSVPNPALTQTLTPERLSNYLRGLGYRVEQKTLNNGSIVQAVHIQKDGWTYDVDIEHAINQKLFVVSARLGEVTSQMPANQLMELLKASFKVHPNHFNIREENGRLQLFLDGPWYSSNMTETAFQGTLDRCLKDVRDTHPQWDRSRWTVGGQAVATTTNNTNPPINGGNTTAPVTTTSNTGNVPAPAGAPKLANTTWVGNENLQGYGRLEFRFQDGGQATMVDKDGATPGTYVVQGNNVTLTFANGAVIYNGTLNGQSIAGTAYNAKSPEKRWNFSVSR
jgi:hypothetical protein